MPFFFRGDKLEKTLTKSIQLYLRVKQGKESVLTHLEEDVRHYFYRLDWQLSSDEKNRLAANFIAKKISRFISDERRLFLVLCTTLYSKEAPVDIVLKELAEIIPILAKMQTGKELARRLKVLQVAAQLFREQSKRMLKRLEQQEEWIKNPTPDNLENILVSRTEDIEDQRRVELVMAPLREALLTYAGEDHQEQFSILSDSASLALLHLTRANLQWLDGACRLVAQEILIISEGSSRTGELVAAQKETIEKILSYIRH